jgi:beta-lactamase regulating signal transducer with metallopeptidase domain
MDAGVILRILVLVAVAVLLFAPTVWAIRDVAHRRFPTLKAKVIWFVVVTLLPPLGGFAYFAVGRPRKDRAVPDAEEEEVGNTDDST